MTSNVYVQILTDDLPLGEAYMGTLPPLGHEHHVSCKWKTITGMIGGPSVYDDRGRYLGEDDGYGIWGIQWRCYPICKFHPHHDQKEDKPPSYDTIFK